MYPPIIHNGIEIADPKAFQEKFWPDVYFYNKQWDIIYSVEYNEETSVPAGNMLGKDFVAGWIALSTFCRYPVVRVVTSSVDQGQLEKVLWGEINRWVQTMAIDVSLVCKHCDIRKIVDGKLCPISYLIGRVAAKEEGLLGHHAPKTLMIYDEGSGIPHGFKTKTDTWAKTTLTIGNPYDCANFFKYSVKGDPANPNDPGGDIVKGQLADGTTAYHRKIIQIKAEDSPNVRYALSQKARGIEPEDRVVVPGVLTWGEYQKRRKLWDKVRQCVSLDAEFYEGADVLLYPVLWLNRAEQIAEELRGSKQRRARTMGVDPAEGGDNSVWTVIDEYGIIEQVSKQTNDTTEITATTIALMRKHNLRGSKVFFDRGGGGKQHADRLRKQKYMVRTVAFGGGTAEELRQGRTSMATRKEDIEERYVYVNRRAQMYHMTRLLLDPNENERGFGIPRELTELRRQMAPIPLKYDDEGRIYMLSKGGSERQKKRAEPTLIDLIGHSPDELESFILAVYGMKARKQVQVAGAV